MVGNLEVRRSVLQTAVDRIQWNFEPMREAGRELFRVIGSGGLNPGVVLSSIPYPNCRARSFLGVYLRATRIVVLFVDRIYAKTLHFLAEPVHLDAAWAGPSAIDGTLIQEIADSKWTGEVAVLYRSADSAQL